MKVVVAILINDAYVITPDLGGACNSICKSGFRIVFVADGTPAALCESIKKIVPNSDMVRCSKLGTAEAANVAMRYALNLRADYLFVYCGYLPVNHQPLSALIGKLQSSGARGAVFVAIEPHMPKMPFHPCLIAVNDIKRVGFFDPLCFEYFADIEWIAKCKVASVPISFATMSDFGLLQVADEQLDDQAVYYQKRNQLFWLRRNGYFGQLLIAVITLIRHVGFFLLASSVKRLPQPQCEAMLIALADFLRGKRGERVLARGAEWRLPFLKRTRHAMDIRKLEESRTSQVGVNVKWNLGDEVMNLPVFEVLKKRFPNNSVKALVNYPQLLFNNPYVDGFLKEPVDTKVTMIDFKNEVRGKSRIEQLRKFLGVETLPFPKLYVADEEVEPVRQKWGVRAGNVHIGLTTEAKWFSRRWPRDNWISLAKYFSSFDNIQLFVMGTDDEPLPYGINAVGQTSVREAAVLLSLCDLFVGSDSGLVHLALAVGAPVVGLYGPLNPYFLIQPRPSFIPLWSDIPCKGCWSDSRMKFTDHCPKIEPDCMQSISCESVIKACESLLGKHYPFLK